VNATASPVDIESVPSSDEASSRSAALALGLGAALVLDACGGGSGAGSSSGGTTGSGSLTSTQASRFLSQSAIGYAKADITTVAASGFDAWLTSQFSVPRAQRFWDFLIANGYDAAANVNTTNGYEPMIWSQLVGSPDILRQRVGLALLNQWVVSVDGFASSWKSFVMAAYLDVLWDNAFGNYRDIMEGVSTSVAMGYYLTFLGNIKANVTTGSIPDENYARELMQLFTIGLYQLNMDGSQVLSGGVPVPTYTQNDVSAGARVWTGYSITGADNTTPTRMQQPMSINAATHETGATTLLNTDPSYFAGITIPAGASGATARAITLDGLFNYPSLAPFVTKQLIQHLVTSNPSPAYVGRVANVFANNGSGVRGDMKAVIRAVLTDVEARDDSQVGSATFGKLREPVVRLVQWAKAFNVTSPTTCGRSATCRRPPTALGRAPDTRLAYSTGSVPATRRPALRSPQPGELRRNSRSRTSRRSLPTLITCRR
jgi:uncharacterized protein (DUF1800 family)